MKKRNKQARMAVHSDNYFDDNKKMLPSQGGEKWSKYSPFDRGKI